MDTSEEIKSVQDEMETNERKVAENGSLNVKEIEKSTVEIEKSSDFDNENISSLNPEKNAFVAAENLENVIVEIKGNNYDCNKVLES